MRVRAVSVLMLAVTGCAAEADDAGGGTDQAITAQDGYRAIPLSGGVYQSVAASGDVAFLGDNNRRIDIVDLNTVRKTGSVAGRIPNDSLTASGGKVVACGLRDDSPLDPFGQTPADRSYVLTVIDAASKKVEGEVKLAIEPMLDLNPSTGIVKLPSLSCRFDAPSNAMTVAIAQDKRRQEIVTFPMPALGTKVDFRAIPGAKRTKLDTGTDDDTVKAAATSSHGITYAAGGYGLRRLAPSATRAKPLRDEDREHLVDLQIRAGRIYAVDHSGGLVVADDATGKTIERVAIPDLLHAIALTPDHVVVMGRGGIFVAKDRWRP